MIYSISLHAAGLIAGLVLVFLSLGALFLPARNFLPQFPRSKIAGAVILTIDVIWSLWLLATMEMGEFSSFRRPLLVILPIGFFWCCVSSMSFWLSARSGFCFCSPPNHCSTPPSCGRKRAGCWLRCWLTS